jgi:hypothetical protein
MKTHRISIAESFSDTPGPRLASQGLFSGEEFRTKFLGPAFRAAREENARLEIDLDGTEGYGSSFLDEVFGGLAREVGSDAVLETLEFFCTDDTITVPRIHRILKSSTQHVA